MTVKGRGCKAKGSRAEREVADKIHDLLGIEVRRTLAGHSEDVGDLSGLPRTAIEVKNHVDVLRAIREGLAESVAQQQRAGADFGALFVRKRGGEYIVVLTPEQFADLWREATA